MNDLRRAQPCPHCSCLFFHVAADGVARCPVCYPCCSRCNQVLEMNGRGILFCEACDHPPPTKQERASKVWILELTWVIGPLYLLRFGACCDASREQMETRLLHQEHRPVYDGDRWLVHAEVIADLAPHFTNAREWLTATYEVLR